MEIKEFTEAVAKAISERDENLIVTANTDILKNNGLLFNGVSIRTKETNIAPVIYIDGMLLHGMSVDEAADKVMEIYANHSNDMHNFDVNAVNSFETIKDKIVAKVINRQRNEHIMQTCPYAQFGDMLIMFAIIVAKDSDGMASIKITNELMNAWKANLAQLIEAAYMNTKVLFPMQIHHMSTLLERMMGSIDPAMRPTIDSTNDFMFVVTSSSLQNGAYFITDRESLIEIAEHVNARQFYILPSSINELIIIPKDNNVMPEHMDEDYLMGMVKEVNATQVPMDEVLADNVYVFDADAEELRTLKGTIIPFIA